jgi:hypothetical protein
MKTYVVIALMSDRNNLVTAATELINANSEAEAEKMATEKYLASLPQFSVDEMTSFLITKDMVL